MRQITVDLPESLVAHIAQLLASGTFKDEGELVRAALWRVQVASREITLARASPPVNPGQVKYVVGVDGCHFGWVVARADRELGNIQFSVVADLQPLFQEAERGSVLMLIDIPIGLPNHEPRSCDGAARSLLPTSRKSSVFPCPSRPVLESQSYADACSRSQTACGKKLSQQAYALLPKIGQVDRLMSPDLQDCVREAHPEVSFALLPGGPPCAGKKSPEGVRERLALLAGAGLELDVARVRRELGSGVSTDDVIDAAACLVSAHRCLAGEAKVCGSSEVDARGLRMEINA